MLCACGPAAIPDGIHDPYEKRNRAIHRANVSLDRNLVRPISGAYGSAVPSPLRRGIGHVAQNLDTPRRVVNDLLQARFADAVHNSWRFLINTTIGIGGLFDPATPMGLTERDTDFGETLHVWGVPEGSYVELPLIGPSTDRDTLGKVVDLALNPLSYVLDAPESYAATGANVLSKVGDRYTYRETVDSILYDSADGYAQARILYLENRRHELRRFGNQVEGSDDYFDPYATDPKLYTTQEAKK